MNSTIEKSIFNSDYQLSSKFGEQNNRLACKFYKKLRNKTNLFFSPINLTIVLSMLAVGACKDTRWELFELLEIKDMTQRNYDAWSFMEKKETTKIELDFASAVCFAKNTVYALEANRSFFSVVSNFYHTTFKKVDFLNVDEMLIVNAVHFYSEWQQIFEKKDTYMQKFYCPNIIYIPMMHQYDKIFHYTQIKKIRVIQIPYQDSNIVMNIFLSETEQMAPISELFSNLSYLELHQILEELQSHNHITIFGEVAVPKFKIEHPPIKLNSILKELGMTTSFDKNQANFQNIAPNAYIKDIIHQAKIEVDEKGTRADAMTIGYVKDVIGSVKNSNEFIVNQPFVFIIRDKIANVILFMGEVKEQSAFDC